MTDPLCSVHELPFIDYESIEPGTRASKFTHVNARIHAPMNELHDKPII